MATVPAAYAATATEAGTTATVDGSDLVATTGQLARFAATPIAPGAYRLRLQADAAYGGRVVVKVDGAQVSSTTLYSDEEEEPMPYHRRVESLVTCQPNVVTRLDPGTQTGRVEIVMVNTHASDRLAIAGVSPATDPAPTITVDTTLKTSDRQLIEGDWGVPLPERADANTAFYAKPTGTTAITVRVIQKYET